MTDRYTNLLARVEAGDIVMIDGGTGTEMERRGISRHRNAWTGGAALSHPDIVRQVHVDYIETGANLIIANTFATHRSALRDAECVDDFEALNRRSVELALEARELTGDDKVAVAAGISYWTWTGNPPPLDDLERDAAQQAEILAAAGAELIILEMMTDVDRMQCLLRAVQPTGLPVWVGLTVGANDGSVPDPDVMTLRDGTLLSDAIKMLEPYDIDLVAIMHTDVELIDQCLDVIVDQWEGPVGVYAHSGTFVDGIRSYNDVISPADYAELCRRWVGRGAQVVGGCCGIRPDHMRLIAGLDSVT